MRSAFLMGRHHQRVGAVGLVAEGACAIAISRGGAPKQYDFTEPNEDACGFAIGSGGAVLAVADGHHGAGGAEQAIASIIEAAPAWLDEAPLDGDVITESLRHAFVEIGRTIFENAAQAGLPPAATTLSVAVVRPGDDLLALASVGDSHIFVTRDGEPRDLSWTGQGGSYPEYLGRERQLEEQSKYAIDAIPLATARSVALVTDGFSESGIGHVDPLREMATLQRDLMNDAWDLRSPNLCRAIVESALGVQQRNRSGDNVAGAVWTAGAPR